MKGQKGVKSQARQSLAYCSKTPGRAGSAHLPAEELECPVRNHCCHFNGSSRNLAAPDPSDRMRYASPTRTAIMARTKKPVCVISVFLATDSPKPTSVLPSAFCRKR